jgi:hypothetical protein
MNALLTAIFDQNPERVRAIAQQQPELLSVPTRTGVLPLALAIGSGYLPIALVLLRMEASGSERVSNWEEWLENYVRDLSESYACAGWFHDIEFMLWCLSVDDPLPCEWNLNLGSPGEDELADLRFLSEKCQCWPYWDEWNGQVIMVALTQWQYLYQDWYARHKRPNG